MSLLLLAGGCARYEYDIASPPGEQSHIGSKADDIIRAPPLEYRFRTVDNYLVIRIYNFAADPIQLLGDQSVIVAPNGQSHPLRSQTIAPGSFIKLIFPPIPPQVVPTGPVIGIGFGARVDAARGPVQYMAIDVPDQALYWEWTDEASVTATFAYREGEQTFRQRFIFARKKM